MLNARAQSALKQYNIYSNFLSQEIDWYARVY